MVPALVIRCLDDPALAHADLSSVRVINTGGQKFQTETKHRAERAFAGAKVQEVFGMAEGQLFISRLDDPDDVRWETVGRPVGPDDEVLLVDDEGRPVAPGDMGELICRGPYTIRGYLAADEHNARAFTPDGFYRTGDVMRRRSDGNYVVEGRMKDLINRGGEKISAEEVEDLALGHPAIRNIAAVAMPDEVLGERMCAFVILQPGATLDLDDLGRYLTERGVARFKHPERLELVDEFPLSPVGKVQKKQLAARLVTEARAGRVPDNDRLPRRIAIVGGGPGGLFAALLLKRADPARDDRRVRAQRPRRHLRLRRRVLRRHAHRHPRCRSGAAGRVDRARRALGHHRGPTPWRAAPLQRQRHGRGRAPHAAAPPPGASRR